LKCLLGCAKPSTRPHAARGLRVGHSWLNTLQLSRELNTACSCLRSDKPELSLKANLRKYVYSILLLITRWFWKLWCIFRYVLWHPHPNSSYFQTNSLDTPPSSSVSFPVLLFSQKTWCSLAVLQNLYFLSFQEIYFRTRVKRLKHTDY